jgi:hypothetical protein
MTPNHSIQRMGASRLVQSQFVAQCRLAPTADAARLVVMRALVIIVFVGLVVPEMAQAAGNTNELSLFKHQGRRQAYEWRISEARIAATPKWDIDRRRIPIAPEKAWRIATAWFKKQGRARPDLVRLEIVPFVRDIDLSAERKRLLKDLLERYYYRIECVPAVFDSMVVIVLMDGSVLEPLRIPSLSAGEIK